LASKAAEKKLNFTYLVENDVPPYITGDPIRLNQVLINLAGNAIKFTESGEVRIAVEMVSRDGKRVMLKFLVSDTGIGIPREKLDTIFKEFVQGANDTTRKYGGSGLGLAIVKQLVEMQGGTVDVSSEPGKGSVFSFTLEFEQTDQEFTGINGLSQQQTEDLNGIRVLVVEDNALNRILVEKHLLSWNCRVDYAGLGSTAIEKLKSSDYDLILMDLQLPEMDGYETTVRIRKTLTGAKANIPIIALTAHALEGEEEKCLASGMNGYLTKPFHPVKMNTLISRLIRKKGSIDLYTIRQYLGDDKKFIAKMMEKFMTDFERESAKLEEAVDALDWDQVRMQAHKMLGSSRIFQFTALNELLEKLETCAAQRTEKEQLPGLVEQLKANYREIASEIKEFIPKVKA
jgi:CheY-like chemotaxis protein